MVKLVPVRLIAAASMPGGLCLIAVHLHCSCNPSMNFYLPKLNEISVTDALVAVLELPSIASVSGKGA